MGASAKRERFAFALLHEHEHAADEMRRAPGVGRQGYHRWRRRPASGHAPRDAGLAGEMRRVWEGSGRIYGSPKVLMRLPREGVATSEERAGRADGAPDLVRRRFDADGPDQARFADIAYVRTHRGGGPTPPS